jgi:hypothetical protein
MTDQLLCKAKSTLKAIDVELTEAEEVKSAPVKRPRGRSSMREGRLPPPRRPRTSLGGMRSA